MGSAWPCHICHSNKWQNIQRFRQNKTYPVEQHCPPIDHIIPAPDINKKANALTKLVFAITCDFQMTFQTVFVNSKCVSLLKINNKLLYICSRYQLKDQLCQWYLFLLILTNFSVMYFIFCAKINTKHPCIHWYNFVA